ncbi:MAG: DMT family transporter [Chitinophagaceae bacterium]|nr:DMT family transporter [Chitinophagaceae bacterium]NCW87265.1 DMT family transporter [Chitinophagia bacterium]NDB52547.1 DMT family transporter [Chitinophagaceae bacterium]
MRKAFYQLHGAVLLAGFTGILGRLITLNELMIVFYRLLITALTMFLLFSWKKAIEKTTSKLKLQILLAAIFAASHWLTFYGAIKYANVSIALVCFALISFFTAVLEPVILQKKFDGAEVMLGILTLLGVYIIFHFDTQYTTGIIMGVISALLASLFPILNREILRNTNVETLLVWQQSFGFLFIALLVPFYLKWEEGVRLLPTLKDWGWLLVLSWFCSVWAFQLSGAALKKLSAFTVNLAFNLEPVYGILLAFVVYREDQLLNKWFYVGLSFILIALALHMLLLKRRSRSL